jgi:uncharacterized protein (TIGR04222 family)
MPIKLSATLLALILLAGVVVGAITLGRVVTEQRDGWDLFSRVDVTTDPVLIEPEDLLRTAHREDLAKVVSESRDYGIPFAVHVITDDGIDEQSANDIAAERYADTPVETREGADDGLLMVVIVTEPDHTATRVGFATGENFYPRGGITPERLDYIATVQMQALIDENRIGEAVIEGATWVEWTQLFQPTPNEPPTKLEDGLGELLNPWGALLFGGLAAVVLLAAVGTKALTWRGTPGAAMPAGDAIEIGAIARGRVDRAVLAGAVLDAVDRGAITLDRDSRLRAGAAPATPRDALLLEAIGAIEARGGTPTPAALGRYLATDGAARRAVEDTLAETGAFDRRSPVLSAWLRGIAAAGTVLGIVGLVLSVLGETAPSLAGAIALTVISLVALIWNEQRSWTTRAGRAAQRAWEAGHASPDDRERALVEAITGMDTIDLRPVDRSPLGPDAQALAASLAL